MAKFTALLAAALVAAGALARAGALADAGIDTPEASYFWGGYAGSRHGLTMTVTAGDFGDTPCYRVSLESRVSSDVLSLRRADMRPLYVDRRARRRGTGMGDYHEQWEGPGEEIDWPEKRLDKVLPFKAPPYDLYCLAYCLRGFPFGREKEVHFRLLMPNGAVYHAFALFLQAGSVDVAGTTRPAYRLKAGLSGFSGLFSPKLFADYAQAPGHALLGYHYTGTLFSKPMRYDLIRWWRPDQEEAGDGPPGR